MHTHKQILLLWCEHAQKSIRKSISGEISNTISQFNNIIIIFSASSIDVGVENLTAESAEERKTATSHT